MFQEDVNINFGFIRLKIYTKEGIRRYRLKKFPVYLGSERSENVIGIPVENIEKRYCKIELIKGKLYFSNLGLYGSIVNNIKVFEKKMELKPGLNKIKTGGLEIEIDNEIFLYNSHNKKINSSFLWIGSVVAVLLLASILIILNHKSKIEQNPSVSNQVQVKESHVKAAIADYQSSYKLNPDKFIWFIRPENQRVALKGREVKASITIVTRNNDGSKYATRVTGDDIYHRINQTQFSSELPIKLIFKKEGKRKVNINIVDLENSKSLDTTFTFDVTKPFIELNVEAIRAYKTVIIKNFDKYKGKISRIDWRDGSTSRASRHMYKYVIDIPRTILINDMEGNRHLVKVHQ